MRVGTAFSLPRSPRGGTCPRTARRRACRCATRRTRASTGAPRPARRRRPAASRASNSLSGGRGRSWPVLQRLCRGLENRGRGRPLRASGHWRETTAAGVGAWRETDLRAEDDVLRREVEQLRAEGERAEHQVEYGERDGGRRRAAHAERPEAHAEEAHAGAMRRGEDGAEPVGWEWRGITFETLLGTLSAGPLGRPSCRGVAWGH